MTEAEKEAREALIKRFDAMRDSGICSPTTRSLLDDAQALLEASRAPQPTDDDREALLAEADALVESWDHKGSWSADSPIGLVMRLARELRRGAPAEPAVTDEMVDIIQESVYNDLREGDRPVIRTALEAVMALLSTERGE